MRLTEITPESMRCIIGSCPAVYETDRGTIVLIGKRLDSRTMAQLLPGKVAPHEEAIEVSRELLLDLTR